eukprot:3410924-Pyramimonas_sp.AAC.1
MYPNVLGGRPNTPPALWRARRGRYCRMNPGFALARPRRGRRWTAWGSTVVVPPPNVRPSSMVEFGVRWRTER